MQKVILMGCNRRRLVRLLKPINILHLIEENIIPRVISNALSDMHIEGMRISNKAIRQIFKINKDYTILVDIVIE